MSPQCGGWLGEGEEGEFLDIKYPITEADLPPQGEIWNFKSPVPEFSPDSSKGKLLLNNLGSQLCRAHGFLEFLVFFPVK